MYKKIMTAFVLLIGGISFVLYELSVLDELLLCRVKNKRFLQQLFEIKQKNVVVYKDLDKLLEKKSLDEFKKQVENISSPCTILKIDIKNQNELEITLEGKREKHITNFLVQLYLQTSGMIKFNSVKIIKDNNKLRAKIYVRREDVEISPVGIKVYPHRIQVSKTNLFKMKPMHKLLAIIHNQQAFIDNHWYKIGDETEEGSQLKDVEKLNVKIKTDDEITNIRLGEMW